MNSLKFEGRGFDFFKIHFVNVILAIVSLSFLYPWARVRECSYLYQNTSLADSPFSFTGTVRVFFKGYLKTLLFFIIPLFAICVGGGTLTAIYRETLFAGIIYWLTFLLANGFAYFLIPVILHGTLNYQLSNTYWRAISPSYSGKISELVPLYFKGIVLTILTLGIYNAWFQVSLNKYVLKNIRFGSLRFDFSGDSKIFFYLLLKGFFLTLVTFGIYGIWLTKQLYEYSVNNIVVKKDDQEFKLQSDANTLEVFEMMVGNFLLVCLTLGIGASWAYMRYYRFIIEHCVIPADFNINSIDMARDPEITETSDQSWLDKWNPQLIA